MFNAIKFVMVVMVCLYFVACSQSSDAPSSKNTNKTTTQNKNTTPAGDLPETIFDNTLKGLPALLMSADWCVKGQTEDLGQEVIYRFHFTSETTGETILQFLDRSRKNDISKFEWQEVSENKLSIRYLDFPTLYKAELDIQAGLFKFNSIVFKTCESVKN